VRARTAPTPEVGAGTRRPEQALKSETASAHAAGQKGFMPRTVRDVKRLALLLLLLPLLAACSNTTPYATTIGVLRPGSTMTIRVAQTTVFVYQPAKGEPRDRFTIAATAKAKDAQVPAPRIRAARNGIVVDAPEGVRALLVRVPDGVTLAVESQQGNVDVTDITGPVRVHAEHGDVRIFLKNGYGEASVGVGNLNVAIGAMQWPGTLHFSTGKGEANISVQEKAAFTVHLHTDDGTLFTDFNLLGTSKGRSETIDGSVNGGGSSRIVAQTNGGDIRLLSLHAQP
jgi:hypothetical protein